MGGRVGAPARGTSHPPWHDGPPRPVFCVRARRRRRGGRVVVLLWLGSWPGHGGAGSQRSGSCRVPGSGSPGRPGAGGASSALAAAEEGEEDRGGARGCASSTHGDHPGACVGRHADHHDMVQLRPGPGHALAVGRPSATSGTSPKPMLKPSGTPSRARTWFPSRVSETRQAPQAASARSSSSTVTPMGRVPVSRGWAGPSSRARRR